MRARFRSLLLLLPALLLNTGVRAGTVDGTINPNYGNNLGRAVVAASPGFGTANPGLRAMATSVSGRTWLFGEDRSGLQNELLLIARLDAATGQIDAGFGGGRRQGQGEPCARLQQLHQDQSQCQASAVAMAWSRSAFRPASTVRKSMAR